MSGRRRLWRVTVVTTHEAVAFTETEQEANTVMSILIGRRPR